MMFCSLIFCHLTLHIGYFPIEVHITLGKVLSRGALGTLIVIFSYLMSGSCPLLYSLPRWSQPLAGMCCQFPNLLSISDFSPAFQILIFNCLLDISPRMFSRYCKQQCKCELMFSLSPALLCIACHGQWYHRLPSYPWWKPGSNPSFFSLAFTLQNFPFFSHFSVNLLSICSVLCQFRPSSSLIWTILGVSLLLVLLVFWLIFFVAATFF